MTIYTKYICNVKYYVLENRGKEIFASTIKKEVIKYEKVKMMVSSRGL